METINVLAVNTTFTKQSVSDLLCNALEGGSNYWYQIDEFVKPPALTFQSDSGHLFRHLDYPMNEGGALKISAPCDSGGKEEINGAKQWTLNLESIQKGLETLAAKYPHHYANFLADNADADTGDAFLQCCLFGEIVFG